MFDRISAAFLHIQRNSSLDTFLLNLEQLNLLRTDNSLSCAQVVFMGSYYILIS